MSANALMEKFLHLNEEKPASIDPPQALASFRHKCAAQKNISKPVDLDEIYWKDDEVTTLPDGKQVTLALVFREGSCKKCKAIARSQRPAFVDSEARPPLMGRLARR